MTDVVSTLKSLALPPFGLFLLAFIGWLTMRWHRRWGRILLGGSIIALYCLSTPFVGASLLHALQGDKALAPELATAGAEAIVVLGAGLRREAPEYGGETVDALTLERLRYAAKLSRGTGLPILVTGGATEPDQVAVAVAMEKTLKKDFSLSAKWVETDSRNTHENAQFSTRMLNDAGVAHAYLVTHAWHMPRAALAFHGTGLQVTPAPTGFVARPTPEPIDFLATAKGLYQSYFAVHELVGYLWYRIIYGS